MNVSRLCILAAGLALFGESLPGQDRPSITWDTLSFQIGDGRQTFALGRTRVPENHAEPTGPSIELAFLRLPSTASQPGPPIVYLAGGPGGSGIGSLQIPYMWTLVEALRSVSDVVLLDQRGTGRSTPSLICPRAGPAPLDLFHTESGFRSYLVARARACADHFRSQRVRPEHYTTDASADDIELLRRALGVEQVSLLGFSYGTHLTLATLRRHGPRIDRAVLAGVEGPDDSEKLPSIMDLQLERLAHYARQDSAIAGLAPDLVGSYRAVLEALDRQPVRVPATTAPDSPELLIGRFGFQHILLRDLGDSNDWPILPGLIMSTAAGRYEILARFARRRWTQYSQASLMTIAVDCASGASPERAAMVQAEARASLFGNAMNLFTGEVCQAVGAADPGPAFRSRIWSSVPSLFISGTLDSQTPPHQAESVRWGFPRSAHVVVEHAGHESTLDKPEVVDLIVRFLGGEEIAGQRVTAPVPRFR